MKVRKKRIRIFTSIALVSILTVAALGLSGCRTRTVTINNTAKVTRGNIQVTVHGTGNVTPTSIQAVSSDYNGRITQVFKNNGDTVAQGDNIVEVTEAGTGKVHDIAAPIAGVVSGGQYKVGSAVQTGAVVCMVQSDGSFNVVVAVDELDINSVSAGQNASITIDAVPGTTFTGTVQSISKLGDAVNGVTTYNVTLSINNPTNVMDSMSASVDIDTAAKQNVLLIPVEALQTSGTDHYVTVQTGSGKNAKTSRVKVGVGLMNDTSVEITSGLSEGQQVVVSQTKSTASVGLRKIFGGGGNGSNNNSGNGSSAASQAGSAASSTASSAS